MIPDVLPTGVGSIFLPTGVGSLFPLFIDPTVRSVLYYTAIYGIVVAVAVWIYRDAKVHGSSHPLLWALATLVFTIIPVVVYMYLRTRDREYAPGDGAK